MAQVLVEGAARLASTLRRAGMDMADLKDSNQRAGQVVTVEAQGRVPRRTGRLGGTIRAARQAGGVVIRAGGSGLRYARFAEFGSAKIKAHHYMYGAADAKSEEVLDIYWEGVEKALAQVQGI